MILVLHHNNKCISAIDLNTDAVIFKEPISVCTTLIKVARDYPTRWIIWCEEIFQKQVDIEVIRKNCLHKRIMISHNTGEFQYFENAIGYIDETPNIKVSSDVKFPTWQMNSVLGAVFGETLNSLIQQESIKNSLDFFLSSIAKKGQPFGLIAFQIPLIVQNVQPRNAPKQELYTFVRQHYKRRWLSFLFFCEIYYDHKLSVFQYLKALVHSRVDRNIELPVIKAIKHNCQSIDVLIPTMGRSKYLKNVLLDLSKQTVLPNTIIIIEQNPDSGSVSQLDYLENEKWPFIIRHQCIQQTGACNARNIGLDLVESDWVFMADDDIRIDPDMIENGLDFAATYRCKAFTVSCLLEKEKETLETPIQWPGFGSGCSFVKSEELQNIRFDMALEHGFGEDAEFGNQLRKNGVDILYASHIQIKHLKAPVGGFRIRECCPWENDLPKPSPTVMVSILKHWSREQRLGYKLKLWIKFYKLQTIKNPVRYFREIRKRWDKSLFWANKLIREHED